MVETNTGEVIAFESLDIETLTYSDLQEIKKQIKRHLREVQDRLAEMEMCPEYDTQVSEWSESEYHRQVAEREKELDRMLDF